MNDHMKEYKLRIMSQNPIIISEAQLNACRDKDGVLKFGRVNEVVSFGDVGVNLKDVRGWEKIELDLMPRGWEEQQTKLNHDGIRKLRLVHAAIVTKKTEYLGIDEKSEVAGLVRDYKARKSSSEYDKRKLFDKLHFDKLYRSTKECEDDYKLWSKSTEALEANAKELQDTAEKLFFSEEKKEVAELTPAEEQVHRVKEILKEQSQEEFVVPF